MDNDKTQPLVVAGKLPKTCYEDANEYAQDLAKVIRIPQDTYQVIQGAEGKQGKTGQAGSKGAKGDKGEAAQMKLQIVPIPMGATYVDFANFAGYKTASYSIHHKLLVGGTPSFDPATAGRVAVGTIIEVAPAGAQVRLFFLFGGIAAVPDTNHVLHIVTLEESA